MHVFFLLLLLLFSFNCFVINVYRSIALANLQGYQPIREVLPQVLHVLQKSHKFVDKNVRYMTCGKYVDTTIPTISFAKGAMADFKGVATNSTPLIFATGLCGKLRQGYPPIRSRVTCMRIQYEFHHLESRRRSHSILLKNLKCGDGGWGLYHKPYIISFQIVERVV